jgi:acyl-CoA dehydrogenase
VHSICLSPEHPLRQQQVARFVEREVEPHAADWEAAGKVQREVLRKLGDAGLLGLMFGPAYGGAGADVLAIGGGATEVMLGEAAKRY